MTVKQKKGLLSFIFIVSILLLIWEIRLYRLSFIPLTLLLSIWIGVGLIATFFGFKNYQRVFPNYNRFYLFFGACLTYVLTYGSIVCSAIVLSNYYFPDSISRTEVFEILEKSSLTGSKGNRSRRKLSLTIDYHGFQKELIFPHKNYFEKEVYKEVELTIQRGLLGFDIIIDRDPR